MTIFLMVLTALAAIFFLVVCGNALRHWHNDGRELNEPTLKAGEESPLDQPIPRRDAMEAERKWRIWQAGAALLAALFAALGFKQLNDRRRTATGETD